MSVKGIFWILYSLEAENLIWEYMRFARLISLWRSIFIGLDSQDLHMIDTIILTPKTYVFFSSIRQAFNKCSNKHKRPNLREANWWKMVFGPVKKIHAIKIWDRTNKPCLLRHPTLHNKIYVGSSKACHKLSPILLTIWIRFHLRHKW